MSAGPRSRAQRRRDTEHRLAHDIDVWVATASADGAPYLVPLSFDWDGEALLVATPAGSPTGKNLASGRGARLGLGPTRDVCLIEGEVEVLEIDALPQEQGDRFAERTGFDPRAADDAVPLVPHLAAAHPGLARGGRALRPRADARRPLAGVEGSQERTIAPRARATVRALTSDSSYSSAGTESATIAPPTCR